MARYYAMTWQASTRRWFKKHRGKMYTISCRQLGTPTSRASLLQPLFSDQANYQSPSHPPHTYRTVSVNKLLHSTIHREAVKSRFTGRC